MTFITGYKNAKGPYITKNKSTTGTNVAIGTDGQDCLIWALSLRNTGTDDLVEFEIYDNATSTDHTGTPLEAFKVFKQTLSDTAESGQMPYIDWELETPIYCRNGAYIVPHTDVDWNILYTELPISTPYASDTPKVGDKQKRGFIHPDYIGLKCAGASYISSGQGDWDSSGGHTKIISTCDCEIWGWSAWNSTDSNRIFRVNNASGGLITQRLGANDLGSAEHGSAAVQKLLKLPMYSEGGLTIKSLSEGGVSGRAVSANILYRELLTTKALDPLGRR